MTRCVTIGFVFLAGCGAPADFASELAGQWDSSSCEAYPAGNGMTNYVKRDFTITASPDAWSLKATVYADAACAMPFVEEDVGGASFDVIESSAAVSGADEVDYDFAYRKLTPLSDAATTALDGTCGSNWTTNVQQDLSATGCAAFGVDTVTSCPTEHDLNMISGTSLYFGDRSGDLCTTRPTMLVTYPVVKQ